MNKDLLNAIKGATVHKNVKIKLIEYIKPNLTLKNIANFIENEIKIQTKYDIDNPLNAGIGFPTGLSLNNLAAHYTPNTNDEDIIFKDTDIIKIDYGVHYNGVIIDSAFTMSFNSLYDEFIEISKKTTDYAISLCAPDVILGELGKEIEEYVTSKEITINNITYKLNVMKELCGHNLSPFHIHAGKAVPNISINYPKRMNVGEFYAIEPFITTGNGINIYKEPNSHYMINNINNNVINKLNNKDKYLYDLINKNFSTLPFCERWIIELINKYDNKYNNDDNKLFDNLINKNILNKYPPIYDIEDSIISQFEHTIYIKNNGIINLTS